MTEGSHPDPEPSPEAPRRLTIGEAERLLGVRRTSATDDLTRAKRWALGIALRRAIRLARARIVLTTDQAAELDTLAVWISHHAPGRTRSWPPRSPRGHERKSPRSIST